MAKISRLSNKTWEMLRPPLINNTVSPALLETILPIIRSKPLEKPAQAASEQAKKVVVPAGNGKPAPGQSASTPEPAQRTRPAEPEQKTGGYQHAAPPQMPAAGQGPSEKTTPGQSPAAGQQASHETGSKTQTGTNGSAPRQPGLFVPNTRVVRPGSALNPRQPERGSGRSPTIPPSRPIAPENGHALKNGSSSPADGARGGMYRPNGLYNGSNDASAARPAGPAAIPLPSVPARSEPPVQKPMQEAPVPTPAVEKPKVVEVPSMPAPAPIEKPAAAQKSSRSIAEGLRVLFDQHRGLPEQAAVLGNSEDNLPVLLDLNDPASGAVVVIGDEREQQIDLLRTAISSIAMRTTPRSAQILIISRDPQSWSEWIAAQGYQRFSIGIEGVEDMDALSEWILRLGDWTEQRRMGERSGPPVLVVLDTLSFMTRLPYDIRLNFEWMVKEGPAAHIWPLAAISTELAGVLNGRRLLRSFPTRVLGFTEQSAFYTEFGSMSAAEAEQFGEPGVFAVNPGECWLRFRLVSERQG